MWHITFRLILVAFAAVVGILLLSRIDIPTAIVYHQFHQNAGGRSVVYLDPFRPLDVRKPDPLHTEAPYSTRAYSPDGSVYIAPRPDSSSVHLFIFGSDDRVIRQLTDPAHFPTMPAASRSNTYPLWSPDGAWIAFLSSNTLAIEDIYIIRPNGTDLRLVAHDIGTPSPLRLRWTALSAPPLNLAEFGLVFVGLLMLIRFLTR